MSEIDDLEAYAGPEGKWCWNRKGKRAPNWKPKAVRAAARREKRRKRYAEDQEYRERMQKLNLESKARCMAKKEGAAGDA